MQKRQGAPGTVQNLMVDTEEEIHRYLTAKVAQGNFFLKEIGK